VTIPEGEGAILENVSDESNTPINCEMDWSMQRRAQDMGRRLIESIGRVYILSAAKGWVGLHTAGKV